MKYIALLLSFFSLSEIMNNKNNPRSSFDFNIPNLAIG
jgi:hypothetical protein